MSAEKQEVPKLSLLDQFKNQRAQFSAQKDFAQNNLNQLVGAVHACDIMIKKLEDTEAQIGLSQENLGDKGNGEAVEQKQEQVA